jgi:hypothetical protein
MPRDIGIVSFKNIDSDDLLCGELVENESE